MASLGISPRLIIEAQYKDYMDSLPEDEQNAFATDMESRVKEELNNQIEAAESKLNAITETASNATSSVAQFTLALATADPTAPAASSGVINSTVAGVKTCKSGLQDSQSKLNDLTTQIEGWSLPLPAPVMAAKTALDSAISAINALPLP